MVIGAVKIVAAQLHSQADSVRAMQMFALQPINTSIRWKMYSNIRCQKVNAPVWLRNRFKVLVA